MLIVTGTRYTPILSIQTTYDSTADRLWRIVANDDSKTVTAEMGSPASAVFTSVTSEDALNIWKQLAAEATNPETAAQIGAFITVVDESLGLPFTEPIT